MPNKLLKEHRFSISQNELSSENLSIVTLFFSNGEELSSDKGIEIQQFITLNSVVGTSNIKFKGSILSSNVLRMLADELDFHRESIENENNKQ